MVLARLPMQQDAPHSPYRIRFPLFWIIPGGIGALLPLLMYWDYFAKFYFLGDEFDLIDKMETWGYAKWVFGFYGENFVPLFKLFWSSVLFAGNGSYFGTILVCFAVHLVFVVLFGYLLRLWGFGLFVVLFSQLVVALNYTGIEILSWGIQVSNLMSYSFFMLMLIPFSKAYLEEKSLSAGTCGLIFVFSLAGALSFPRGTLNGFALFGLCVILFMLRDPRLKRLWRPAMFALAPCLIVALTTIVWSYFNSALIADSGNRLLQIRTHFLYQLSLNPWYQQLRGLQISASLAILLLQLNLQSAYFGIRWAKPVQRPLFYIFLLFFLGNAFLLAWGRNHMPIPVIASWRYQYGVLIIIAPFVGIILEKALAFISFRYLRIAACVVLLSWVSNWVFRPWKEHLTNWSVDRGSGLRLLLDDEKLDLEAHTISRYDPVSNKRALELIEKYHLH